jgi:hypothetical protein
MNDLLELTAYAKVEKHPMLPDFYILTLCVENKVVEYQLSMHALDTINKTLAKAIVFCLYQEAENAIEQVSPAQHLPASTDPTP